jgi:hypothetical protein
MYFHAIADARAGIERHPRMQTALLSKNAASPKKTERVDNRSLTYLHIVFDHHVGANRDIRAQASCLRHKRSGVNFGLRRRLRREPSRRLRKSELRLLHFDHRFARQANARTRQHTPRCGVRHSFAILWRIKIYQISRRRLFRAGDSGDHRARISM